LDREWVLSANGRVGYIFGFNGRDVRVTDRFFLGGDSLRGFEPGGVGPRDVLFNDALGANQVYNGTVELRFPTPLPEELGINFRVFTDFGTAKKIDGPGSVVIGGVVDEVVDKGSLRASAGLGATWKSPFGPVRVDMAVPYKKEDFDRKQLFRISFGTRF
jgi:outer membrane protein insertion porin family